MARVTAEKVQQTKDGLLDAARSVLSTDGYSGISTRAVASEAGVPMSQIQYHFGSKQGLLLALFEQQNAELLARQNELLGDSTLTLAEQWKRACDYLDDDLLSGYVRILNELNVAGWSDPVIGSAVSTAMAGWHTLLTHAAQRASERLGGLGPFHPEDIAVLVSSAFLGAEINILSGHEQSQFPIRRALRRIGEVIERLEKSTTEDR